MELVKTERQKEREKRDERIYNIYVTLTMENPFASFACVTRTVASEVNMSTQGVINRLKKKGITPKKRLLW